MNEFYVKLLSTEVIVFIIVYLLLHPDAPFGDLVIYRTNLDYGKVLTTVCFIGLSIILATAGFFIWS